MATFFCPETFLNRPIRVLLLGAGGTGGEVLDGLCRLHHGLIGTGHPHGLHVTVMDGDTVSPSNIGRQRFSPADIGQFKATLLVHRLNMFYGLDWEALPFYFDVESHSYSQADLLITCVDKASVRVAIGSPVEAIWRTPALWLDFGNAERTGQVVLGHLHREVASGLRLPHVFDLYPELSDVDDDAAPSCSLEAAIRSQDLFINRLVADVGLSLLWDLLRQGRLERHGGFVDLSRGTVTPLLINSESWGMFGYTVPSSVPDSTTT